MRIEAGSPVRSLGRTSEWSSAEDVRNLGEIGVNRAGDFNPESSEDCPVMKPEDRYWRMSSHSARILVNPLVIGRLPSGQVIHVEAFGSDP